LPEISVLVFTGFRAAAERAAQRLRTMEFEGLLLNLPEEMEGFLKSYINGRMDLEELLKSYRYLTGSSQPFVNALRYRMEPLLTALPILGERRRGLMVECYQDLESSISSRNLSERLLLLEAAERIRGRISVTKWRDLLREEIRYAEERWLRERENIVEKAGRHPRSLVLYGGSPKALKEYLERRGFSVNVVFTQRYWRPPLEVLRMIASLRGVEELCDRVISDCVQRHLQYLDYILLSGNIDEAHEKWTRENAPFPIATPP
jgi:hypothetical protein